MLSSRRAAWLLVLALALGLLAGCGSSGGGSTSTAPPASPPQEAPATHGLQTSELTIDSKAVGKPLEVSVIDPGTGGPGKPPLLVFLHGAGGRGAEFLHNEAVTSTLEKLGGKAPVVAFPDGEMSWWHKRETGDWSRYVVREVIPDVARRYGADPRRVAIGGISMGGYGAYHLGLLYSGRFCAVGGHSAGLWLDEAEEFPGAFDGPEDYERNDVIAAVRADPDAFGEAPVWNDYGDEDWFVAGNAEFVRILGGGDADLTAHVWPGGHEGSYWNAHFPQYLRFYANALARC